MSYNLPIDLLDIDSSGDLNLTGDVTANAFIGDGSQLTNLPSSIGSNPFDQDLNTTDSPTFVDGDFSGRVLTNKLENVDGYSYIRVSGLTTSPIRFWRDFQPQVDNSYSSGSDTLRWSNTYSVDGSFTGSLNSEVGGDIRHYSLGDTSATDNEYLKIYSGSIQSNQSFAIEPISEGSGVVRDFWIMGGYNRTRGYIKLDRFGAVQIAYGNTANLYASNNYTRVGTKFYPDADNTHDLGLATFRFANTYSVNGSFTGTLDTEVGGSMRMFNLGTSGDADTEYLEISNNGTNYAIFTAATGSGVPRNVTLGTSTTGIGVNTVGQQLLLYGGGALKLDILGGGCRFRDDAFPFTTNTFDLGTSSARWANVASVDGDFSGSVTTPEISGVSSLMLTAGGGSPTYFKFGSTLSWIVDSSTIRPTDSIGSQNIGLYDRRIGDVMAFRFGATESYKLYNLGTEADTDTEYLDISANSNRFEISPKASGAGAVREILLGNSTASTTTRWHGNLIPFDSGSSISMGNSMIEFGAKIGLRHITSAETDSGGCLETTQRFSSGTPKQTWNQDGAHSFYGVQVSDSCDVRFNITNDAAGNTNYERVRFNYSGTKAQLLSEAGGTGTQREFVIGAFGGYQISMGTAGQGASLVYNGSKRFYWSVSQFSPFGDNLYNLGGSRTSDRWKTVFAVDGSFGGNLNVEAGGSRRIYNLGAEGDTDTEYFETIWAANNVKFRTQATGAGNSLRRIDFEGSSVRFIAAGVAIADMSAGDLRLYSGRTIRPLTDNTASIGKTGQRFTNVYSYDGDFAGTVTAAETFIINRTVNNASTVFQVFDANITDTASDANSNLLNLKVDGVQKFRVKKDGTCTATAFVGNGSGLTNVNPDTGEDYTWTGENTFDGDIVMAANVDFTGLPTSDPNTEGRLYNDSGTVKVSSGGGSPPP